MQNQIGPGNAERAWNDPPKLAYNSPVGSKSSKDRLSKMQKRVPISLNNVDASATLSKPPQTLLMVPPKNPVGISKEIIAASTTIEDNFHNRDEQFNIISKILNEAFKNDMNDNSKVGVYEKIEQFQLMWTERKLNLTIECKMIALCKAISCKDFDKAWALHQEMMVDYTSLCSSWMIGIKALILALRVSENAGATSTDKEQDN